MMTKLYQKRIEFLLLEAKGWIGVAESGGLNKGPEVEQFQKAVDGKAVGEAWCLAFLQFCLKKVDEDIFKSFGGPIQKSWIYKTEHVMTCWNITDRRARLKEEPPSAGCLVVWQHYKDSKPTSSGHIGLVSEVMPNDYIKTIEGNTSPTGTGSQRDGDGVYEKIRNYKSLNGLKFIGFLRPWDAEEKFPYSPSVLWEP